jgi:integrase
MGVKFLDRQMQLRSFCRAVGNIELDRIRPKAVRAFIYRKDRSAVSSAKYAATLAGLYRFAIARGYATRSPMPTAPMQAQSLFKPYIYSQDELRHLLDMTPGSQSHGHCIISASTLRMLILLLYGSGLRLGEALRLRLGDVDLNEQLLTIHQTKFGKTRLVPIGAQLARVMHYHLEHKRIGPRGKSTGPFFTTIDGDPITGFLAEINFRRLRRRAGIQRAGGVRMQPRLHDLRHTFAAHRLVSWYRKGLDVQALLPHLSTYLGHLNLTGTQRYLTITPELATEAGNRFERYAASRETTHE